MTTWSKHQHWLIYSATSVLKCSFIARYLEDDNINLASSLPFSGPVQLPTKMQALKLFWFIKDEVGWYNSRDLSKGMIFGIVVRVIRHGDMAGYKTVSHQSILNLVYNIGNGTRHCSRIRQGINQKLILIEKPFLLIWRLVFLGGRDFIVHGYYIELDHMVLNINNI